MGGMVVPVVLLTLLCIALAGCQDLPYTYPTKAIPGTKSLYFGLLQSFGGSYNSSGSIPGVEVALDRINNDTDLLPGYTLRYILRDTFCDRTTALDSLHQLLFDKKKTMIAVMGSGCSPATEPTAEIDHYYNLTHISCVANSQALGNRTRYRYYYQMLPSEADIAPAYYGVIREYGWEHVAFIVQNENLFTLTVTRLIESFANSTTYSQRMFETRNGIAELNGNIFDPEARIFIIATFTSHARNIICEAYRRGYRYPQYMFLTYAWYPPQWWNSSDGGCSREDKLSVLRLTLAFLHFPYVRFVGKDIPTDTGVNGSVYMDELGEHSHRSPLYLDPIEGSAFCHDATWAFARALNQTLTDLMNETFNIAAANASGLMLVPTTTMNDTSNITSANVSEMDGQMFSLENFTYSNDVILNNIFKHMADTRFIGVTGEVKFRDGIRDVEALRVLQIQEVEEGSDEYDWVKVGTVMADTAEYVEVTDIIWPQGVPYDGVPREELVSIHPALTGVISVFVAVGIIFSVICIVFNIVFRKKKLIRLSSPKLNYIICVGAIVVYVDMILFVIPSTNQTVVSVLCNLTPWLTSIGYSLAYGTILVKMFRVYYIYSNPSPKKKNTKIIKDEVLTLMVFCMVGIDVLMLVIYGVVEGLRGNLKAQRIPNEENFEDKEGVQEIVTKFFVYTCDTVGRDIFLGILYGYKALLQILALFLAFATRRVKVKGLNDTKGVAAAVYITSLTFTVLFVCTYTVSQYINGYAAIVCMCLFIGTTSILALLFIPKMIALYQDPEGVNVFKKQDAAHGTSTASDRATIESLRRRVRELETMLPKNSTSPHPTTTGHLHVPSHTNTDRLSQASDISLEMRNGRKTIWDEEKGPGRERDGVDIQESTDL